LVLRFLRLDGRLTELTYHVEFSSDLQEWFPLAGIEAPAVPCHDLPGYEWTTFTAAGSPSAMGKGFVRIRCEFSKYD
jgi:hypothetical protein